MEKITKKLAILRRNNQLSQQSVAEQINIDVFEYMSLENGSQTIDKETITKIAKFYKIAEKDLIDDNIEIEEIKEIKVNDKVGNDPSFIKVEELKKFHETSSITMTKKDLFLAKIDKLPVIVKVVSVGLVLVIVFLLGFFFKPEPEIIIEPLNLKRDINDKVVGNNYGIIYYVQNNLKSRGLDINGQLSVSDEVDIVKVEMNDSITALLKRDGTIILKGSDALMYDIEKFGYVKDIALGDDHLVAISHDDKVLCSTSTSIEIGCNFVEEAYSAKIDKIFAFDHNTILIDVDGNIYTNTYLRLEENIKDIEIESIVGYGNNIWALYKDGTIQSLSGDKYDDALEFTDVKKIVLLNDALFIHTEDNKVHVETKNNAYKAVSTWEDVLDIAGKDDYLVGLKINDIIGVGNNAYDKFNEEALEQEVLKEVSNIAVNVSLEGVSIKFDTVENADKYLIKVNNENEYEVIVDTNELIIPLSNFKENTGYTISVVAMSNDEKYLASEENNYHFVFYQPIEEVVTPEPTTDTTIIPPATTTPTPNTEVEATPAP